MLVAEKEESADEEDDDEVDLLTTGAHCVFKGKERKELMKQLHNHGGLLTRTFC